MRGKSHQSVRYSRNNQCLSNTSLSPCFLDQKCVLLVRVHDGRVSSSYDLSQCLAKCFTKKESESEVAQSCLTLCNPMDCATPWTVACQAPPSVGFSRQEYWGELPFPFPGDLPDPGKEPRSPTLQGDSLPSEPPGNPPRK